MRSHAEAGLDRVVYDRFFAGGPPGVFVDVGAAGPELLSMSAMYRQLGWRVLLVEPNPLFCAAQRAAGHEVLECACGDRDEDNVWFEMVDSHGSLYEGAPVSFESFSSLKVKESYRALANGELEIRRITVRLRRLDTLLAEHAPELDRLDVVSVDVEGWELEVLAGFSLERYRPRVLIVENVLDDDGYRRLLDGRGYRLWRHVVPNDVYVPY